MNAHNEQQPAAAQEAVATVESFTNGSYHRNYKLRWHKNVDAGTQLFAAPVTAAPASHDVPFATVQRVVHALMQCGVSTPYSQEEQSARSLELIHWLCDEAPKMFSSTPITAAPGIDLSQLKALVLTWRYGEDSGGSLARQNRRDAFRRCANDLEKALSKIDASPKGALNEQFGSAEGLSAPEDDGLAVRRVADHMAQVIDYIGKRHPDAALLDRGPILRNIRQWEKRLRAVLMDSPKGGSTVVAELVEAISAFKGKRGAFMALGAQDARTVRLWSALARAQASDAEVRP